MTRLPSRTRTGRKVFVTRNSSQQPDFWPGDEVWADEFTLLGIVSMDGEFLSNPAFAGVFSGKVN